jgi:putative ATP-binding cassette transporter
VSRGFWTRRDALILTGAVVTVILMTLFFQYRINIWNRELFDALEQRDSPHVLHQTMIYVPLLVGTVFFAVANVS